MAEDGADCKLRLTEITFTGNRRYPKSPADIGLDEHDEEEAIRVDIARRIKPTPLKPCQSGQSCRILPSTAAWTHEQIEWIPVNIMKNDKTLVIEYEARVRHGIAEGVCIKYPTRPLEE